MGNSSSSGDDTNIHLETLAKNSGKKKIINDLYKKSLKDDWVKGGKLLWKKVLFEDINPDYDEDPGPKIPSPDFELTINDSNTSNNITIRVHKVIMVLGVYEFLKSYADPDVMKISIKNLPINNDSTFAIHSILKYLYFGELPTQLDNLDQFLPFHEICHELKLNYLKTYGTKLYIKALEGLELKSVKENQAKLMYEKLLDMDIPDELRELSCKVYAVQYLLSEDKNSIATAYAQDNWIKSNTDSVSYWSQSGPDFEYNSIEIKKRFHKDAKIILKLKENEDQQPSDTSSSSKFVIFPVSYINEHPSGKNETKVTFDASGKMRSYLTSKIFYIKISMSIAENQDPFKLPDKFYLIPTDDALKKSNTTELEWAKSKMNVKNSWIITDNKSSEDALLQLWRLSNKEGSEGSLSVSPITEIGQLFEGIRKINKLEENYEYVEDDEEYDEDENNGNMNSLGGGRLFLETNSIFDEDSYYNDASDTENNNIVKQSFITEEQSFNEDSYYNDASDSYDSYYEN